MKKFLSNIFIGEAVEFSNEEDQGKDKASYECSAKRLFWSAIAAIVLMILATVL